MTYETLGDLIDEGVRQIKAEAKRVRDHLRGAGADMIIVGGDFMEGSVADSGTTAALTADDLRKLVDSVERTATGPIARGYGGTYGRIEAVAERLRYKPGAKFEVRPSVGWYGTSAVDIVVSMQVADRDTGQVGPLYFSETRPVQEFECGDEGIARMFFNLVRRLEEHEAAEFFHLDGIRIYDPHTSNGRR